MSRRCKAGKRAKVIRGLNIGRVVLVVKALYTNEFDGSAWPKEIYPWVVTSLGAPLRSCEVGTGKERPPAMTVCVCDLDLEPLDDDDDGLTRSTEKDKPKSKPKAAKPKPEMADPQAS